MKIEKIIVGVDFGEETESVLAYAALFAEVFNASLNLLYVIDYLITPPAYLTPYIEDEKSSAEKNFKALRQQLTGKGIRTETEVIVGRLHESFERTVEKTKPDMLVLGFMTHAFRRSSSEKLVKGLRMPMLVVKGKKASDARIGSLKIRKILCPVDFSEASRKALDAAKEISAELSAKLDILYVVPNYLIRKMKGFEEGDRAMQELIRQATDDLGHFLKSADVKETGHIDEGEPDKKIVSYSDGHDIDLIIMGARGLGLIKGMLIGSVTDAVLKLSTGPVLVIH